MHGLGTLQQQKNCLVSQQSQPRSKPSAPERLPGGRTFFFCQVGGGGSAWLVGGGGKGDQLVEEGRLEVDTFG